MKIKCYKNNAEDNVVDKGGYLTLIRIIEGVLREDTSLLFPEITFELDTFPDFNYIYIEEFNRYYFVEGIDIVNNKLYTISFNIDVLYSHIDYLTSLTGLCKRNEYVFNKNIIDDKIIATGEKTIDTFIVHNELFKHENDSCFTITGFDISAV